MAKLTKKVQIPQFFQDIERLAFEPEEVWIKRLKKALKPKIKCIRCENSNAIENGNFCEECIKSLAKSKIILEAPYENVEENRNETR